MSTIIEQPEKICAICGATHYLQNSGYQHGTFHEINKENVWIGTSCFGNYTCMIAEGLCSWEKIPTRKELYRVYQRYAKKHQDGEPWWCGWIYCDSYEKKRWLLDKGVQAFMEREF